jgi:hypothetical protein
LFNLPWHCSCFYQYEFEKRQLLYAQHNGMEIRVDAFMAVAFLCFEWFMHCLSRVLTESTAFYIMTKNYWVKSLIISQQNKNIYCNQYTIPIFMCTFYVLSVSLELLSWIDYMKWEESFLRLYLKQNMRYFEHHFYFW